MYHGFATISDFTLVSLLGLIPRSRGCRSLLMLAVEAMSAFVTRLYFSLQLRASNLPTHWTMSRLRVLDSLQALITRVFCHRSQLRRTSASPPALAVRPTTTG